MSDTKDFVWTDELAEMFAKEYRFSSSRISLEMFKAANQPKVPLFTTEDGVEIFEGNKCWWVNLDPIINDKYEIDSYDFDRHCDISDLCHYPNKYKYFSTEEKAKEWVLLNKPIQVTYKEIDELFQGHLRYDLLTEQLHDFFQSKINP